MNYFCNLPQYGCYFHETLILLGSQDSIFMFFIFLLIFPFFYGGAGAQGLGKRAR